MYTFPPSFLPYIFPHSIFFTGRYHKKNLVKRKTLTSPVKQKKGEVMVKYNNNGSNEKRNSFKKYLLFQEKVL